MKPSEIIDGAIAIVSDYTDNWPASRPTMMRRINQKQQQVFSITPKWDREYYGICAICRLDSDGRADLEDIEAQDDGSVYEIEMIDDIRISGTKPSGGDYDVGQRVNLVPAYDAENHLAPRMTLRSRRLESYGNDFEDKNRGYRQVEIFYSRRPLTIKPDGIVGDNPDEIDVELESPFDDLLVWDLAKDLIRRTIDMDPMISEVETELLASYEAHVLGFAHARQDRFKE